MSVAYQDPTRQLTSAGTDHGFVDLFGWTRILRTYAIATSFLTMPLLQRFDTRVAKSPIATCGAKISAKCPAPYQALLAPLNRPLPNQHKKP